jgi:hypothetical protein
MRLVRAFYPIDRDSDAVTIGFRYRRAPGLSARYGQSPRPPA